MLKMPGLTALISQTFSVSLELGPFFCSLSRRILLLLHLYLDAAPVSAEGKGGGGGTPLQEPQGARQRFMRAQRRKKKVC